MQDRKGLQALKGRVESKDLPDPKGRWERKAFVGTLGHKEHLAHRVFG